MKSRSWMQIVVAALLVLAAGAIAALAGATQITVAKTDGEMVKVTTNGVTEEVRLGDLADGEERVFDAGDHDVTVRREGDSLTLLMDGVPVGRHLHHKAGCDRQGHVSVWSDTDEELIATGSQAYSFVITTDGEDAVDVHQRIAIIKSLDGEDISVESFDGDGDPIVFELGDGGEDKFVKKLLRHHGLDQARYRCADDGTTIMIPKEKDTQDTYLCPVCGREMERTEGRHDFRVMTIVETDDEEASPQ